MPLHRIETDLDEHAWYVDVVERTLADVESFAARWAEFEELVGATEPDEPATLYEASSPSGPRNG
jgi:hypothetical protein